jgi:hypothetical protein
MNYLHHLFQENHQRRSFRAIPMPETTYESDFQVEYEEREPLVSQSMNFKLDKRAEKRKEFDDMMAIKMNELDKQKEMAAMRKLEAENRRYVYIFIYIYVYMCMYLFKYVYLYINMCIGLKN